jgi:hypothetical protein
MTPQPSRTPREVREPLQQAALAADKTVSLVLEAMEACPARPRLAYPAWVEADPTGCLPHFVAIRETRR